MTKDGTLVIKPKLDLAEKHFREAIRINPKDFKSYFELGILLAKEKKYKDAFMSLNMSIKINPKFADGHYELAVLLMNKSAKKIISKS